MKGYIGIDLPTQPYIKGYLLAQLGEMPIMNGEDRLGVGRFFINLLCNYSNYNKCKYQNKHLTTAVRLYINMHTYKNRGHLLHETNIMEFNLFVKGILKARFHELMDDYVESTKNLTVSLELTRSRMLITEDYWSDESMLRDYHRYRKRHDLPLLYDKKQTKFFTNLSDFKTGRQTTIA